VQDLILVIGGGTMGAGIAYVAARGGYAVELVEPDAAARERAMARIAKDAARAGDDSVLARIAAREAIPSNSAAAIAIEAVPERLDLKRTIFAALEQALDPHAILATNTSSLSVAELARTTSSPQRVIGLHFFNPPAAMKLVEIVETEATSDDTIDRAHAFVERIGKTGVICADTPGFIVNRVARPFYLQSMRALERKVAAIEELDALARSVGFRMGPFELMDLIGIDVNLAVSESVYDRLESDRLEPRPMQSELVAAGRLGRKTGSGFYAYENGNYARLELDAGRLDAPATLDEKVCIIGYNAVADGLALALEPKCTRVQRIMNDDMLDDLDPDATLVIDVGDGFSDRAEIIIELDRTLDPATVIFADAYVTDLGALAPRLRHPERVVGYGILGALEAQSAVEIVDAEMTGDDALALAQECFEAIGKAVVLVADAPGLFLGRVVGGIVNEAMLAVAQDVALPDDVDLAMELGVNYPRGPIAWGREIGGERIIRILARLALDEGKEFAPHRSLRMLDAEPDGDSNPIEEARRDPMNLLGG
jgi:3-hydroxybutyryl-CoA dehydrogenase